MYTHFFRVVFFLCLLLSLIGCRTVEALPGSQATKCGQAELSTADVFPRGDYHEVHILFKPDANQTPEALEEFGASQWHPMGAPIASSAATIEPNAKLGWTTIPASGLAVRVLTDVSPDAAPFIDNSSFIPGFMNCAFNEFLDLGLFNLDGPTADEFAVGLDETSTCGTLQEGRGSLLDCLNSNLVDQLGKGELDYSNLPNWTGKKGWIPLQIIFRWRKEPLTSSSPELIQIKKTNALLFDFRKTPTGAMPDNVFFLPVPDEQQYANWPYDCKQNTYIRSGLAPVLASYKEGPTNPMGLQKRIEDLRGSRLIIARSKQLLHLAQVEDNASDTSIVTNGARYRLTIHDQATNKTCRLTTDAEMTFGPPTNPTGDFGKQILLTGILALAGLGLGPAMALGIPTVREYWIGFKGWLEKIKNT